MGKNICTVELFHGEPLIVIHNIRFKGKRKIKWNEVENYLKQYIGKYYTVTETQDIIHIKKDFIDEYSGSKDTARLRGTLAKAKANAAQGIPEMLKIAVNKRYKNNLSAKHKINAKYGWYRYDSRFALPVCREDGKIERYNIFQIEILIRYSADRKMYLYDLVNIKKETSTPLKL